jgi:hypothetical protein
VLTDRTGREAPATAMAVAGWRARWAAPDAAEDAVRRTVLLGFAGFGVPAAEAIAATEEPMCSCMRPAPSAWEIRRSGGR